MSVIMHLAANGDLFTIGHNLATRLGALVGLFLVLGIGVAAFGHVMAHRVGAAVVLVLVALIPAWFLLDPVSATNTLKNTIGSL